MKILDAVGRAGALLLATTAVITVSAEEEPKGNLQIYALAGVIHSDKEMLDEKGEALQRCYVLNADRKWTPARLSRSGLAYGFVKAMLAEDKDISIGLVFADAPGTMIEDWHRKSEPFRLLRGGFKSAKYKGEARGLVWRHGNSALGSAVDHMKDIFAGIRVAHGLNLPVVVGELPGNKGINSQLAALASGVHALKVASVEEISAEGGNALREGGLVELGERCAKQMLEIQAEWSAKEKIRPRSEIACFDAHVHGNSNQENGLDIVGKWMARNNVKYCIDHALTPTRAVDEKQRQFMLANYAKHKGRILRFTYIEPDEVSTVEEAVKILEKEKADGAVGFGEHYGRGLMFDDPKNLRLYAACEKVGLPVMFHIDGNKNMVEKRMSRVERVLEMYPRCILIAHAQWWEYMPDGTCDRMLQKYPNLYADTSGEQMLAIFNRDRGYTREFLIRNADKVLYGSDEGWWSFKDAERGEPFFQICDEINLPEDVKEKVYRKNAEKLFAVNEQVE